MTNLLIVDDEFLVVESITQILVCEDLDIDQVFGAYSVAMAKDIIKKNEVSIIITDIEMSGQTGLDLLKWVKEQGWNVKAILLTGHKKFEYAYEAVSLGVIRYLVKPVDKKELLNCLIQVVSDLQREETYERWLKSLSPDELEALGKREREDDLITTIKNVVKSNLGNTNLNRAFIAKAVYLNEDYLSYIFHEKSGMTLKAYINSERFKVAKKLIATTEYPFEVIGTKAGFSDTVQMRKVFKKLEGITPYQYREKMINQRKTDK